MISESVCPCREGRCDCDACWHMREATGGEIKGSPLCEKCFIAARVERAEKRQRERVRKGLSYEDAAARCAPAGPASEMWREAFPACVFPAAHGLPIGERVPAAWKTARDWCVREVAEEAA